MKLPVDVRQRIVFGDYCWLWIGPLKSNGYAQIWLGNRPTRRRVYVHRLVYTLLVGPIPKGLVLDHLCRVRRCCNPAHLEPVTPGTNVRRGRSGQFNRERAAGITHCPKGHEYTPENTRMYRTRRHCRTCGRAASTSWYHNNRKDST